MKKGKMLFLLFLVIAAMAIIIGITRNRKADLNVEEITVYIYIADPRTHYVIHITSDRKLVHQEFFPDDIYPDDPERNLKSTTERILSEEEYSQLVETIGKNSFMDLPEDINAKNILDGNSIYIEVRGNGISHKVGGYMPQSANKKFNNIYEQFRKLTSIG